MFTAFQEIMPASFVIFTTAYDEYAMQAIKNHGIDYLLKPIDEKELRQAIRKVSLGTKGNMEQVHQVMSDITHYKERLIVYKGEEIIPLQMSDILYFPRRVKICSACQPKVSNITCIT